jgi:hypothetical protein
VTAAVIIVAVLLVGIGLVASQLVRLKDWLDRQPPPAPPESHPDDDAGGPGAP